MSDKHVSTRTEVHAPKKRKKSKQAAAAAEDAAHTPHPHTVSLERPTPESERNADDIERIFAGRLTKRAAQAKAVAQGQTDAMGAAESAQEHAKAGTTRQPKRQRVADRGSKDDIFAEGLAKGRRVDEEGLPVYSTEELNVGKGGNTAACPFDCECCL